MNWKKVFNRYTFIVAVFTILFLIIIVKLFSLQIVHGEEYRKKSAVRMYRVINLEAPRGEILDRYGRVLASNDPTFALVIDPNQKENGFRNPDFHKRILQILNLLYKNGEKPIDNFPISVPEYTFQFNLYSKVEEERRSELKAKIGSWQNDYKMKEHKVSSNAKDSYAYLRDELFEISSSYSEKDTRRLLMVLDKLYRENYLGPVEIALGLKENTVAMISELQSNFPGVYVIAKPVRHYKYGSLLAHVLGYTGNIDQGELTKLNALQKKDGNDNLYGINDEVGKMGIESIMERQLKGKDGIMYVEEGKNGKNMKVLGRENPEPGNRVFLTIDQELQKVAEESLIRTMGIIREGVILDKGGGKGEPESGSVVVLDVNTGAVLALVSYPSFEPALFQNGISDEEWKKIISNPLHPLYPRAIAAATAPGSTFKALTAIAGLETGAISSSTIIPDPGYYKIGNMMIRDAIYPNNHGLVDVRKGLEESVNSFFLETASRVGISNINKYGKSFGFGQKTGIELPGEARGGIASPEHKKEVAEGMKKLGLIKEIEPDQIRWNPGDTVTAGIGQSNHAVTPIQMANFYAQISNGGVRYKTHIINKIENADGKTIYEKKPEVIGKASFNPQNMQVIKEGLLRVTQGERGTARGSFKNSAIVTAAKTGTAEVTPGIRNNAWFAAYAPYDNPQIAVVVNIEHGAHGGNASYVGRDIIDTYFRVKQTDKPISLDTEMIP